MRVCPIRVWPMRAVFMQVNHVPAGQSCPCSGCGIDSLQLDSICYTDLCTVLHTCPVPQLTCRFPLIRFVCLKVNHAHALAVAATAAAETRDQLLQERQRVSV